jgi:hypothetical protein
MKHLQNMTFCNAQINYFGKTTTTSTTGLNCPWLFDGTSLGVHYFELIFGTFRRRNKFTIRLTFSGNTIY